MSGRRITVDFKWTLIEKRQEKLKTQRRDISYKLKSKLVVIRRNIQNFTGTVLQSAKLLGNHVKRVL